MLGGKRCYLCGGKLVNGRCVECGLDNEKNTKKVYHLNESVKMQDSQPRDAVQKIGKGLAIGSVILLVAAVGAVALNSYFEEQEKGQSQSGEEYDEYQFAKRQLSETGEAYDEVLTGGYYEVGVHIPEGIYTVEAQDGESAIYLIDDENGIYIWQQIGNDPENPNQVAVMDDLRLYDGALLEVKSGAALQFRSDCAQTERLHGETNPLQDSVRVEVGQTMTAGRDFPEGLYNVKSEPDWNDLMMTLPDSFLSEFAADEERRVEVISFAPKELELSYENVPIPKGTEIQTTGAAVTLEPSEKIGSTDYGEFYKE